MINRNRFYKSVNKANNFIKRIVEETSKDWDPTQDERLLGIARKTKRTGDFCYKCHCHWCRANKRQELSTSLDLNEQLNEVGFSLPHKKYKYGKKHKEY